MRTVLQLGQGPWLVLFWVVSRIMPRETAVCRGRASRMAAAEDSEAFESAVSRLPYPVFVVDSGMRLRAMNPQARALWKAERLHEQLLQRPQSHPLAEVIKRVLEGHGEDDDTATVQLARVRYEVIHSTRSPKGQG